LTGRAGRQGGFTLIELLVVIAVLAILALIALPTYLDKLTREQIAEALPLAEIAKQPIGLAWSQGAPLPADNAAAGLPAADRIVNTLVSSVTVEDGAIHIRFGNNAHRALKGRTLTLRPAVVEDARVVPLAWLCARAPVPGKMSVKGIDRTDIPAGLLPLRCR
jgi:type IV pilus assembly protein PilA